MLKTAWRVPVAIMAAASILLVSACNGSGSKERDDIPIGLLGPESGQAAVLGLAQKNAVLMAVDEINANGGVNGRKLKVFSEDDEGSPTKSANAATKLVYESKVVAVIGALQSSATLATQVITGKASIPQIAAGSTAVSVTEQNNPYLFRTAINDAFQVDKIVDLISKEKKYTTVALVTASDDYGQSGVRLFQAGFQKVGVKVVASETFNNGDKDFKSQIVKIGGLNPQAVVFWGQYAEAALLLKQARQLDFKAPFYAGSGVASLKLMELGGNGVEGMIVTQSFLPNDPNEKVQSFVKKYREKFKEEPVPHAAQAYDTVYVLADAVKRAGSTDPKQIRDALAKTTGVAGVTGTTKFNEKGDDIGKRILVTIVKNGTFELVGE